MENSSVRYYGIAGITIELHCDFPVTDDTFDSRFQAFRAPGPGKDNVVVTLRPRVPPTDSSALGREVYRHPPWAIYRTPDSWTYLGIPADQDGNYHSLAVFDSNHGRGTIYRPNRVLSQKGIDSLTTLPSD